MIVFSPTTILFPPYILSSFIICIIWLYWSCKLSLNEIYLNIFNRNIWLSRDIMIDFIFCIMTLIFLSKIFKPIEEIIFNSTLSFLYFHEMKLGFYGFKFHPFVEAIMATAVTMFFIDFASYLIHLLMHKNRIFWKIHSLHHSVTKMNFLSTHRQNPLELIVLNLARVISAAIGLSLFHLLFPSKTPVILIHGLGAGFFVYMFTINLHHFHIPVRYPKIFRWIFISPHIHQIHHSRDPKHFGKNLGVVFSIWDRIFNTYLDEEVALNELRFGLK